MGLQYIFLSPYQATSLMVYIQIIFTILKSPQERTHLISSHFLTYRQQSQGNAGFVLCCPSLTRIPCYPTGMSTSDTEKPFLPELDSAHSSSITLLRDYSICDLFILLFMISWLLAISEIIYVCFKRQVMDNQIQMNLPCDILASVKKL